MEENKTKSVRQQNPDYQHAFDLEGATKDFAVRVIKLYQYLTDGAQKREFNLSKMFLMAGTSIGDYVRQEDFRTAYAKATSAQYWTELLVNGGYLTDDQTKKLMEDALILIKYLYVCAHPESRKAKMEGGAQ